MNSASPASAVPSLSRRQFGLIVGGGALLLVGGGTCGIVSRSRPGNGAGLSTTFGTLSLVDAGRLARLDAQGRPAATPLASAVSQVTDGTRRAVAAGQPGIERVSSRQGAPVDDHHGDPLLDSDWPQPGNFTWGDVVVLEVALTNVRPEPVLFSPGQLRLKLLPSGVTVARRTPTAAPARLPPVPARRSGSVTWPRTIPSRWKSNTRGWRTTPRRPLRSR